MVPPAPSFPQDVWWCVGPEEMVWWVSVAKVTASAPLQRPSPGGTRAALSTCRDYWGQLWLCLMAFFTADWAMLLSSDVCPVGSQVTFDLAKWWCFSTLFSHIHANLDRHQAARVGFRAFALGSGKTCIFVFRFPNGSKISEDSQPPGNISHPASTMTSAMPLCGGIVVTLWPEVLWPSPQSLSSDESSNVQFVKDFPLHNFLFPGKTDIFKVAVARIYDMFWGQVMVHPAPYAASDSAVWDTVLK